ncbi:hypothetical protein [Flavobacterium sp. 120]|uniref:hypothetical protein n=1 Tax=Flavobacterium sp. 120 TaxID=2135626 RepID=UPI000EB4B4D1|nr:hypothetical protein [Flavobacterium sp. 120]RKS13295.1 hypothetical protein C8C87_0505 [Flavobacterium sp. 120]
MEVQNNFRSKIRGFFTKMRIFINSFNGFLFHSLYCKFSNNTKNYKKVIINSNVNYYEKTCIALIDSLVKYGVKKDDIILMVGGFSKIEKFYYHGVESYFLDNNTIDFTAFIGVLDLELTNSVDYFFYIHDTTVINSKKFTNVFYKYPVKKQHAYSIGTFISMNIGFYSKESLIKNKTLIMSAKNTDYSRQGVYNSKVLGFEMEDAIFKNSFKYRKTIFLGYSFPIVNKTIYVGQERIEENFKYLGILKYKANSDHVGKYKITLTD